MVGCWEGRRGAKKSDAVLTASKKKNKSEKERRPRASKRARTAARRRLKERRRRGARERGHSLRSSSGTSLSLSLLAGSAQISGEATCVCAFLLSGRVSLLPPPVPGSPRASAAHTQTTSSAASVIRQGRARRVRTWRRAVPRAARSALRSFGRARTCVVRDASPDYRLCFSFLFFFIICPCHRCVITFGSVFFSVFFPTTPDTWINESNETRRSGPSSPAAFESSMRVV
ncbi:hypothetical protein HPB51_007609 [Rhipicephalus microplus]|uniref:Uncharacterized protein n=1 Tax=Rhipicephalus microplus TaxID=6941 RepID=A0A9J6D4G0_RHIMP|nr:hypothetical protein HPB51_007609 [Rhipicephalus microplus]